jgi:hypothetical protein
MMSLRGVEHVLLVGECGLEVVLSVLLGAPRSSYRGGGHWCSGLSQCDETKVKQY